MIKKIYPKFTCKCGCKESRRKRPTEVNPRFINRKHYGVWLKTNHNLWGVKNKETDKEWTEPRKETSTHLYSNTGSFPMFI